MRQKNEVRLGSGEVEQVQKLIKKGVNSARIQTRARVLLLAYEKKTDREISNILGLNKTTPQDIRRRFVQGGIHRALYDLPRPGQKRVCSPTEEATITAIACTSPPDGYARWTLDLLQEEISSKVKRIGRTTIHRILLKNELTPWREKNVVYSNNHT